MQFIYFNHTLFCITGMDIFSETKAIMYQLHAAESIALYLQ